MIFWIFWHFLAVKKIMLSEYNRWCQHFFVCVSITYGWLWNILQVYTSSFQSFLSRKTIWETLLKDSINLSTWPYARDNLGTQFSHLSLINKYERMAHGWHSLFDFMSNDPACSIHNEYTLCFKFLPSVSETISGNTLG